MKSHAHIYGRLASVLAVFMIVCVTLFNAVPAPAQQAASLVIAKTLGAGMAGEPVDTQARFKAVQLLDLKADAATDLGKLAQENPRLLGDDPGYRTGQPHFADTNEEGKASFYDLQPGVYQVSEVSLRTGNEHRDVATPILVYIGEKTSLVRAKNQPTVIEKKASSDEVKPGDELTFHITTSVPPCDANGELHQYVAMDTLASLLSFKGIKNVRVSNVDGDVRLVENEDYVVEESGNRVTFSLKKSGLAKLAGARDGNPETKVHFDIVTSVKEEADSASTIHNTVLFSPDGYCVPKTGVIQAENARYSRVADEQPLNDALVALDCATGLAPEKSNTVEVALDSSGQPGGSSNSRLWWPIAALIAALGLGGAGSSKGSSEKPGGEAESTDAPSSRISTPDEAQPPTSQKSGPLSRALDSLASTGASVIGIILAGLALIALSAVFLSRRRERDEEVEEGPAPEQGGQP
ncbi:isopeptide-forming domain-containing fimbrial protein [Corynebacterium minutissimum]|uniref:Surface-anchored fimbrial subunit n=1 Tax=Corynebacterium minutissimum TaxID=38301 RepID=A0A376D1M6_9CORY|nr:isopeptide-forming domain-containing fimbrial protein [Corynebacterium minutissimum]QRP61567.1 isopeptide-forming domain-containing fimbrial protein [Corynebacterium minutissimum]STC80311.1 surface-anchored fimbrial subunit [Corynebacterium minutissimum]